MENYIYENKNLKKIVKKYKQENELKKLVEQDSESDSETNIVQSKVEPKVVQSKVEPKVVQSKVVQSKVVEPKVEKTKIEQSKPKYTTASLNSKSMVELKDICRTNGIAGYSKYVKKDLIVFILKNLES